MKKIGSKQVVPIVTAVIAVLFGTVGFLNLGFWNVVDGPMPGFFPSIMAAVMLLASILAFIQSFKETEKAEYNKNELLVIAAGAGIILGTFIIGLVASCFAYVVIWLKLVEKASWKSILIICAVVGIIVIGVFGVWLGIQFPMGLFEYIL